MSDSSGAWFLSCEVNAVSENRELLQAYIGRGDESAFAEIVRRHVDLVHSAAIRQLGGDAAAAQDVTQSVFVDLARKAPRLPKDVVLAGWLHRHTGFLAANHVRASRRRGQREAQALLMQELQRDGDLRWEDVGPILDEAIHELPEGDRDALLLRYFEDRPLRAVGEALGTTEDAARKRVERAMDRLRAALVSRGVTSTSAALASVISANAVSPAPAGLAVQAVGAALAGGGVAVGTAWVLKSWVTGAIAAAAVAGGVGVWWQSRALRSESMRSRALEAELAARDAVAAAARAEAEAAAGARSARESEHAELLRLRGEVARLRASALHSAPPRSGAAATPAEASAADPATLARTQVTCEARFIVVPDHLLPSIHLGGLAVGGQMILEPSQVRDAIARLDQTAGVTVLSAPKVTTLSGRSAQVSAVEISEEGGVKRVSGPSVDLVPAVTGDGIFRLTFSARWKSKEPVPEPDANGIVPLSIGATLPPPVEVMLRDGDTVVTRGPVPPDLVTSDRGFSSLLVFISVVEIDPAGNRVRSP